jgi:hypothetical protein
MADDVLALRRFRDRALKSNAIGQLAVATYYSLSPPIAHAITTSDAARAAIRRALVPVVSLARTWLLAETSANAISAARSALHH